MNYCYFILFFFLNIYGIVYAIHRSDKIYFKIGFTVTPLNLKVTFNVVIMIYINTFKLDFHFKILPNIINKYFNGILMRIKI